MAFNCFKKNKAFYTKAIFKMAFSEIPQKSVEVTTIKLPITMAGIEIPAIRAIPTGAPTIVPSCHNSFFLRLHGFLPQKVHPEGDR